MCLHPTTLKHGNGISLQQAYKKSTLTYPMTSSLVSMQASDASLIPSPHQTNHPSMNTKRSLTRLYKLNSKKVSTLALSPWQKLRPCWVPSTHPHSPSYQNPGSWANSGSSKIYPHHILPWAPSRQLTAPSTLISTPACGVLSPPYACSSGAYPQAHRQLYAMSRRHTETSPSNRNSGQDSSSTLTRMTALQLTCETVLAWLQGAAYTATWVMQEPKSCTHMASALCPNGWMITSSSESPASTLGNTISTASGGHVTSQRTEEKYMMEATSGSKAKSCQMTSLRNSMRISPAPSKISHKHQTGLSFPARTSLATS